MHKRAPTASRAEVTSRASTAQRRTRQLMLSAAADMACVLEHGIDFYAGDYSHIDVVSTEDCCAACSSDPDCIAFSYHTETELGGLNQSSPEDPHFHKCALKRTFDCPACKKEPNQNRISGVPQNASAVNKCLSVTRVQDPMDSRRYMYASLSSQLPDSLAVTAPPLGQGTCA